MYSLLLIVTRGRSSIFLIVDIYKIWSEERSSRYSVTDYSRSRTDNRAVKEVSGSSKVGELAISIRSDGMRSWLRLKIDSWWRWLACTGRIMYITKIFRNFALFVLFAFNHQPRPEVFWRHSPLTFYIYNFNPIFNSIQRSKLNCQFARNIQIKLNWIKLGSIQSQLFELLRALPVSAIRME